MKVERACKNCEFWKFLRDREPETPGEIGIGECRRRAPKPSDDPWESFGRVEPKVFPKEVQASMRRDWEDMHRFRWRMTMFDDWCGEFSPAPLPEGKP